VAQSMFPAPVGSLINFGEGPRGGSGSQVTPGPQSQLNTLLANQPSAYDAAFEYAARRRMIEEMLSNLRPAQAGSHLLYGATNVR
jgi:hypothetical protein